MIAFDAESRHQNLLWIKMVNIFADNFAQNILFPRKCRILLLRRLRLLQRHHIRFHFEQKKWRASWSTFLFIFFVVVYFTFFFQRWIALEILSLSEFRNCICFDRHLSVSKWKRMRRKKLNEKKKWNSFTRHTTQSMDRWKFIVFFQFGSVPLVLSAFIECRTEPINCIMDRANLQNKQQSPTICSTNRSKLHFIFNCTRKSLRFGSNRMQERAKWWNRNVFNYCENTIYVWMR